ncbi:MAG TPA: pyridoxamine 5'-phosphate oxidase family protein [Stellaceae bacterium]|jgi:predicted pyridoxine 5'-phosphate oxidase superfamily flavin-nucleotide-binding protein|nr:pyridoxamine 5'-phosphate oxidase family protein [Stellaceae bacterium]
MTDKIAVVMEFLGSLRGGSAVPPRVDLLTEDATYMSSRGTVTGRDAAMKYMAGPTAFTHYKSGNWSEPKFDGEIVEVTVEPEPGAVGSILRCQFRGDVISLLQDKAFGRPAVEQKGITLSAEVKALIKDAAANKSPLLLAYVDETGQPSLSFRGSTHAHSDDQLGMWLRKAEGGLITAIAKNPKVALMYRDAGGGMFHFQGRARITSDPKERQAIYDNSPESERNHDLEMHGAALIVDLDFLQGFLGRTSDGRSTGRVRMRR